MVGDTGLIQVAQSLRVQGAKELSLWVEKSEVNQTTAVQIVGVDAELL